MRPSVCTLFLLPVLTAGCKTISNAPPGQPRVELEVTVAVEQPFLQSLTDADAALSADISEAVLDQADVGLRFYPVASADYAQGQQRPAYLMTVRVESLDFDVKESEKEGEVLTRVSGVKAGVAVALEKRHTNAPALLVASAGRSVKRTPYVSKEPQAVVEASYSIRREGETAAQITRRDIVAAVRTATRESLGQMLAAIDREFTDERQQSGSAAGMRATGKPAGQ